MRSTVNRSALNYLNNDKIIIINRSAVDRSALYSLSNDEGMPNLTYRLAIDSSAVTLILKLCGSQQTGSGVDRSAVDIFETIKKWPG